MTNKEFYGDKLFAALIGVSSCQLMYYYVFGENCNGNNCEDCRFSSMENIENWLNAEHKEPPRLQNGDGLKPGSRIMVRNDDKENWTSQVFLCFIYGYFVCVCDKEHIGNIGNYRRWKYARLPEDGE